MKCDAPRKRKKTVRRGNVRVISPPPGLIVSYLNKIGFRKNSDCEEDGTCIMLGLIILMGAWAVIVAVLAHVANMPTMHISVRTNACVRIIAPDGTEAGCDSPPALHHTIYVE